MRIGILVLLATLFFSSTPSARAEFQCEIIGGEGTETKLVRTYVPGSLDYTDTPLEQDIVTCLFGPGALSSRTLLLLDRRQTITEIQQYFLSHDQMDSTMAHKIATGSIKSCISSFVGGCALVGAYIGWNYWNPIGQQYLPDWLSWLEPSIPPTTFIVSMNLLSPYLDTLSAQLRRLIFKMGKTSGQHHSEGVSNKEFYDQWVRTQQELDLNEEMGRNTVILAQNTLSLAFTAIAQDSLLLKPSVRKEYQIQGFVLLLTHFRKSFPDIHPWRPNLTQMARLRLKAWKIRKGQRTNLLKRLRKSDQKFNAEYYKTAINAWLPIP